MQVFLMHVGHPGYVDIAYTVTKRRNADELLAQISSDAPERAFFEGDQRFISGFPDGKFHCWGIPLAAKPRFDDTQVGDLVLIAPMIGLHPRSQFAPRGGGVYQLGIVKAKCPERAVEASAALWPNTPYERPYPWLMFFDTEAGYREWYDFLDDIGYEPHWNPHGWYRRIADHRFRKWAGPEGYLKFLRRECGFAPI